MAILVIGGQSRNIGKTAVVCGLILAVPERCWTAIKTVSYTHLDVYKRQNWNRMLRHVGNQHAPFLRGTLAD